MHSHQIETHKPQKWFQSLYIQVIIAIFIGGLIGYFYPEFGESLKPLGDAFVKLIKMIIAPVIFITISTGIGRMNSLKGVGKTAIIAFSYFFIFSTFALILGLLVGNFIGPGHGMNIDVGTLSVDKINEYQAKAHSTSMTGFLLEIIPSTFLSAFVEGNILQVLFVAVLFGISLVLAGDKGKPITEFLDALSFPIFRLVDLLMKAAPIGAFGAIAFTVGKFGVETLKDLAGLIATFYLTSAFFIIVILGIVGIVAGFSIFKLIAFLKEEIFLVLGTSSSEAALPKLMEKLEFAGCKRETIGLVVPSGYSFNLDGTNIYLTLAALFIAQATNTHLTLEQQILLFSVAIVSSKGAAGVTGAGFITLAATLSVVPSVPIAGMALILGVDRFMSECRAITNFIGNAVATIVVSKIQNSLDKHALDAALSGNKMPILKPIIAREFSSGVKIGEQDED